MDGQLNILLMRHAKSSWEDRRLRDYDRPLNKRGKRDAPAMGAFLKKSDMVPDLIISSPAVRARETALLAAGEMDFDPDRIVWSESLYFDGPDAYIHAIRRAEPGSLCVMTVGHNPMTEYAISLLTGIRNQEAVPTAAITCLEVSVGSWDDLKPGSCSLLWMKRPKDLSP